ncbi:MAG TPA: two-component system response regulator [Candidatus Hypogeohydataceae bacterium YC41]
MHSEIKKILLIEDNPGDARLVLEALATAGGPYELEWANCLSKGLEILESGGIDIVLTDIGLPDSQGLETFKTLLAHSSGVPIVLLTSLNDDLVATEAVHQGAQDCLVKGQLGSELILRSILYSIERHQVLKKRMEFVAGHNPLTGLPNQSLFLDHLNKILIQAGHKEEQVAVLHLYLTRIEEVWKSFGRKIYEALLLTIIRRLNNCIRATDSLAHIAEDGFAVAIKDIHDNQNVIKVARRILDVLSKTVVIDDREFLVTCNIGASLYPAHGDDGEKLLRNATIAMSQARVKGINTFCLYSPELGAKAFERWESESNLREALKRKEFLVYYQPMIDLKTHQICGMEALIRWERNGKLIQPLEFIQLAEETELIIPIGEWVLRSVCIQKKTWQKMGYPSLLITVNISAVQFEQPNLVKIVKAILEETGLGASHLGLEITESTAMKDAETSIATLRAFKEMGMYLLIDDFGIGYSSMAYLSRLSVDSLKIDRSFVSSADTNSNNSAIVRTIVAMAHSIGLETVAEGVETEEQMEFLRLLGCEKAQGYLFSPPVPAEEATRLLSKRVIDIAHKNQGTGTKHSLQAGVLPTS